MNLLLIILRFLLGLLPHRTARLQPIAADPHRAKHCRDDWNATFVRVPGWGWLTLRFPFSDGPAADDAPLAGCIRSNSDGPMRAQANRRVAS